MHCIDQMQLPSTVETRSQGFGQDLPLKENMETAAIERAASDKAASGFHSILKTIWRRKRYLFLLSIIGFLMAHLIFGGNFHTISVHSQGDQLFFIDEETETAPDRTIILEKIENDRNWNNVENRDLNHTERRVISMVLFGSSPRYTNGALANAKLYKEVYPGWELRVYLSKSNVPADIIENLKSNGVEIVYMEKSETKIKPRLWRYLIAKDYSVDRFIVRDIDSRLLKRDKIEVDMWIKSGKALQCVRDHPGHTGWALSGGMWGGVPSKLKFILPNTTFGEDMVSNSTSVYEDQIFLARKVWRKAKYFAYCSDSFSCKTWDNSYPFQTKRSKDLEFVGEVILGNGQRRPSDLNTIKKKSVSEQCKPK